MKELINCLGECRRQFARYASEHKAKAAMYRLKAAETPSSNRAGDNFAAADEMRQQARASDAKAKTNLEMVAKIDDALSKAVDDGK